jgi:hypothetical protein
VDREAYLAAAATIDESRNIVRELSVRYPNCIRPALREITFVHHAGIVYLKTLDDKENLELEDTSFISDRTDDDVFFTSSHSPNVNADLLVQQFDPYSIINCFQIFTSEAGERIAQAFQGGVLETLFPSQPMPGASA